MQIYKVCFDEYLKWFNHIQFGRCKTTSELSLLVAIESKHSRSHKTVSQKIIITNYSIQNSINKAVERFGMERKSIKMNSAVARNDKITSQILNQNYTKRNKADTKELEDEFVEWILKNQSFGIAVISWEVIL